MTKCDVCNRPNDEVDVQPYMSRADYGYEERVGTCNCDACPVCGYIHRNWCEQPPRENKDERAPTCSSCGGNSPEEFCGYCEEKGYHNPDDDRERCADCGYKHDGKCRVDLGRYIQPPLEMKSQIHKVSVNEKPITIEPLKPNMNEYKKNTYVINRWKRVTDKPIKVESVDPSSEEKERKAEDSYEAQTKREEAFYSRIRVKKLKIEELELDERLFELHNRQKARRVSDD